MQKDINFILNLKMDCFDPPATLEIPKSNFEMNSALYHTIALYIIRETQKLIKVCS